MIPGPGADSEAGFLCADVAVSANSADGVSWVRGTFDNPNRLPTYGTVGLSTDFVHWILFLALPLRPEHRSGTDVPGAKSDHFFSFRQLLGTPRETRSSYFSSAGPTNGHVIVTLYSLL